MMHADHHLPYQNGLLVCTRELFNPLSAPLCSVPLSLLIKKPLLPLRGRNGLCDMSPPPSRCPAPANKPLSFPSAPASQMLAFIAAGSQSCMSVTFLGPQNTPVPQETFPPDPNQRHQISAGFQKVKISTPTVSPQ